MADEAIHSLLETLSRFLKQHHHSDINRQIISINDESVALQFRPQNPAKLEEQIREVAATTKEMIEYFLSEDNPLHGGRMTPTEGQLKQLKYLAEYFKSTVQNLKSTPRDPVESVNTVPQLTDISSSVSSSQRTAIASKDIIIGFDEDLRDIKNCITGKNQPSQLQVLSIVGTGGIGKTTLAKLVYNDESVAKHFDIRAWVTISHDYSVGSIVFNLLASLEEEGIPVERDGDREISAASLIQTHLNQGRFLIVIDDVCSEKAWDDLKTLFPDTGSSSQIMLTTRLHDVADYVNSSIPVHFMRLLDAHHSWDLLKKKVFVDKSFPIQLEDVGRKIVKICGGLPLSIVMVAGSLSMLPKTRYSWKQYATNHGTLETVITRSYNHLPDNMRECFLYMGGFPEDYEIRVSELIKLWIGEGFLKGPTGSISLEKKAAKILDNLVERSLVLVGKRKLEGEIKNCSLHDIVRDFCIREAEREKFLLSVMDYLPTSILRRHFLPRLLKNYGRISASSHDLDLKDSMHSSSTHSIICIPQRGYKCVSSMSKFSSLRVFHVLRRKDNWEWEPSQVLDLVDLTYLASNIPIVPLTISKFENLQTLIIYRSKVVLPVDIWKLRQLRHLMAFSFDSLPQPNTETLPLENLQVMSLVFDLICSVRMMEMIPNIKKLGIFCRSFRDCKIYNLVDLHQLEKLKLVSLEKSQYDSRWMNPIFPPSLKKLTLCGLRLPWKDMRIIGSLPCLQTLKLKNYACHGIFWETTDGEFKQLEFLVVDESYLIEWVMKSSHFPKLKSLALHRCPYLSEIPYDIGNILTLELIKVDVGNQMLVDSAEMIQKENSNIQVCCSNTFLTQQRELAENVVITLEEDLICSLAISSSSNADHLHHLKECFLYMAAFPNDYEIRVSEIIKLWVAEGFLRRPTETRSLEEEAQDCLNDLVRRRLVLVTSRRADGKIKGFRLNDTVRGFCVREAIQRKFILPVMDDFPSNIMSRDFRRISVGSYNSRKRPEGSLRDFTSLKVLHVLRKNGCSFWKLDEVFDHIHLTYLASNIPSNIVPTAISKLQNLETLIIYRYGVYLPVEIWRMRQLRHLMAFSFHPLPNPEDADLPLENLHTLSLVRGFVCSQRMAVMIPNIKKLGLCYGEKEMPFRGSFWQVNLEGDSRYLDKLALLLQLEKLKLEMPTSFWTSLPVFPQSLKKLSLSGGGLPWSDMKIIGSLPNLQELKLKNYACHGEDWKTTFGEFPQLRFLLIDESYLQHWETESSHFPRLECLMLRYCLMTDIGQICTLKLIQIYGCNQSLLDSAKKMQEIHGTHRLEVRQEYF